LIKINSIGAVWIDYAKLVDEKECIFILEGMENSKNPPSLIFDRVQIVNPIELSNDSSM
jgi:hypothetical protein